MHAGARQAQHTPIQLAQSPPPLPAPHHLPCPLAPSNTHHKVLKRPLVVVACIIQLDAALVQPNSKHKALLVECHSGDTGRLEHSLALGHPQVPQADLVILQRGK